MSDSIHELVVAAERAGERLDRYLSSELPDFSRARLQALIDDGQVTVDGRAVKRAEKVRAGARVVVRVPAPVALRVEPEALPVAVIYEDEHLIAVDKPAGLAVHPGAGRPSGTLVNRLLAHCRDLSGIGGVLRPGIVHRLDGGTSGVMVVAKNDRAHEGLARQFARREAVKVYTAFTLGVPSPRTGVIKTLYGRHPTQRLRFSSKVRVGKTAITRYRLMSSALGAAQLEVRLETGRTHQIRVHFADQGHPLLGDPLYGGRQPLRVQEPLRALVAALSRQALHAAELRVVHPVTGEAMVFRAELPRDLAELAAVLGG